jgi:hypothetical protein
MTMTAAETSIKPDFEIRATRSGVSGDKTDAFVGSEKYAAAMIRK